jgi:FkbM family methyltransferase
MISNTDQQRIHNFLTWFNNNYLHLPVVLYDIGARYGIHYLYTELLKLKNFSVVGFEPDSEEAAKLNASDQSGITKTFPIALAESKGVRKIYITKHPGCSSLYPPNKDLIAEYSISDLFEVINTGSVETISIDEFADEYDVAKADFLKIDIQGAEYEVLKGGKSALNNNVLGIFLETHLREIYLGSPLFFDIHNLLTDFGFKLMYCEYNPNLGGEILELDVAYVKDIKYLHNEENVIKSALFCLMHKNFEFAASLVRKSCLTEAKKIEILEILGQPLHHPQFLVNPEDLYVKSNVELRKIKDDWWIVT